MSLDLDKRQRAMLREMGVRVWQPMAPRAAVVPEPAETQPMPPVANMAVAEPATIAIDSAASRARMPQAPSVMPPPVRQAERALDAGSRPAQGAQASQSSWSLGEAVALYADTATGAGARWLVLAEMPAGASQGGLNPFVGDAGKLLDNMLRAAKLHKAGAALLAPLARQGVGDGSAELVTALPELLAATKPDVILVMGRLAASALLQSSEAFGKLRGQVHEVHGIKTVVTQDANFLLRQAGDKPRAWEDLCLAIAVANGKT